jgi:KUP system potassium uptake protein
VSTPAPPRENDEAEPVATALLATPRHRFREVERPRGRRLAALSLAALGVVYGDIGTSPLYALRECFHPVHGLAPTPEAVLGILSLIFWALVLVVTVKYVVFVMRLDNRGEGGIMALLALVLATRRTRRRPRRSLFVALGLFGAALLYGDGIITPAISVLGAVEGLGVAAPGLEAYVPGLAVAILLALFALQPRGTARIGGLFGPIMLVWFVTIAALGVAGIARAPEVLAAVNPGYGLGLFVEHGWAGFLVLGAVVLAVTGAEALYADLGHFGARPIRLAWLGLVFPALVLNYFGQGALVLRRPDAAASPFYLLAPEWFRSPLLLIATLAAIVASQALISGAFSLTQQAIQLRYAPRMAIVHTSRREIGQIYLPAVNHLLAAGCVLVVLAFRSSSALGAAYGIAVTGTMAITTLLFSVMARDRWGWPWWAAGLATGLFLVVDLAFFGANLVKVERGGWVPLVLAAGLYTVMETWNRGTRLVTRRLDGAAVPLDEFIAAVRRRPPARVPGTAVILTHDVAGAPLVLQHHLRHNKALHERVVLLSVLVEAVPEVDDSTRVESEAREEGFFQVRARYGFMERANVPAIVRRCCRDLKVDPGEVTYIVSRARLVPTGPMPMMRWRKRLFAFMARNAAAATDFFHIPPHQVVELGAHVEF